MNMKKVLNNIFKWLLLVWISYSLIYTGIVGIEQAGIIESIAYRIENIDGFSFDKMERNELKEICKNYQEMIDETLVMNKEEIINADYYSENEKTKLLELNEVCIEYPSGYTMFVRDVVMWDSMTNLQITSLIMGIAVGTALYLMLDKEKKGLKVIISLYVIFVIILGFVEGIQCVAGENLTLFDRWTFPESYIIPITAVFILAIIVRVLRQKDLAKELNRKLQEKNKDKIESKKEE